jgi:hypothetical protein
MLGHGAIEGASGELGTSLSGPGLARASQHDTVRLYCYIRAASCAAHVINALDATGAGLCPIQHGPSSIVTLRRNQESIAIYADAPR